MVVLLAASGSTATTPPVDDVALVNVKLNSSGPSISPSSVNGRSMVRSVMDALSVGAV